MLVALRSIDTFRAQCREVNGRSQELESESAAVVMRRAMRQGNLIPKEITIAPKKPEHPIREPDGGVRIRILLWIATVTVRD